RAGAVPHHPFRPAGLGALPAGRGSPLAGPVPRQGPPHPEADRRRAGARRRALDGEDHRDPSGRRQARASRRPGPLPPPAGVARAGPLGAPAERAGAASRAGAAQAREGDMQRIADALLRASLSAETRARRPATVAFVRESLMRQDPEGYARTCEALAEMTPA